MRRSDQITRYIKLKVLKFIALFCVHLSPRVIIVLMKPYGGFHFCGTVSCGMLSHYDIMHYLTVLVV